MWCDFKKGKKKTVCLEFSPLHGWDCPHNGHIHQWLPVLLQRCPWLVLMSWVTNLSGMYTSIVHCYRLGSWLWGLQPVCQSGDFGFFETWGHEAELPHKAGLQKCESDTQWGCKELQDGIRNVCESLGELHGYSTCFQLQGIIDYFVLKQDLHGHSGDT